jgi:hypothetical protein
LVSSSAFGQVVANAGSSPLGDVIFTQPVCPLIDAIFYARANVIKVFTAVSYDFL